MMKTVVFHASPRRNGNTAKAVTSYLYAEEIQNAQWHHLADYEVKHCTGCLSCVKTGECIFKDDMSQLYEAADQADLLIFASPVYFNSVTSIGKTVIDRFQRNYARRFVLNLQPKVEPSKKGTLIMTAGSDEKNSAFDGMRKPLDLFFKSNGIVGFEEILLEGMDHEKFDELYTKY